MRRFLEQYLRTIPDENLREQQAEQFELERESLEKHRAEMKRMLADMLRRDARILVIDVSHGGTQSGDVPFESLSKVVTEEQFGGAPMNHGEIFRHMLGFDPDDPRVTIWDVAKDPDKKHLPYPDVFVSSGGPAMPSELDEGNKTENTEWLARASAALEELHQLGVPGDCFCLSHQLFNRAQGANVGRGRREREFGTVPMQVLYGFETQELPMSASHSEEVIALPEGKKAGTDYEVIAFNDYSDKQGLVYPAREGEPVTEAMEEENYILTLQNHPEILAVYLAVISQLRGEKMRAEGLQPEQMLFKNTPEARSVFKKFIERAVKRQRKRS